MAEGIEIFLAVIKHDRDREYKDAWLGHLGGAIWWTVKVVSAFSGPWDVPVAQFISYSYSKRRKFLHHILLKRNKNVRSYL